MTKDEEIASLKTTIRKAASVAERYGMVDGAHHKTWVIDQMVRILLGKHYPACIELYCEGENGPKTYSWDVGIPP